MTAHGRGKVVEVNLEPAIVRRKFTFATDAKTMAYHRSLLPQALDDYLRTVIARESPLLQRLLQRYSIMSRRLRQTGRRGEEVESWPLGVFILVPYEPLVIAGSAHPL